MSPKITEEETPIAYPSIKATSTLAKTVKTHFFRTLETNGKLVATKETFSHEKIVKSWSGSSGSSVISELTLVLSHVLQLDSGEGQ